MINLKELRKEKGITQLIMTSKLNVTQSCINKWEKNPKNLTLGNLQRYFNALGYELELTIRSNNA